jgi:opacity protein-like surface antigen
VRQAAAIGLALLVLVVIPDSARSDTAKVIVEGAAAAALVSIVCSSVAITADDEVDEDDFARRGWLVGVGGSYAFESFEDDAEADFQRDLPPPPGDAPVALSVDNSFGFNGRVGYRCHRYFSAEVEVEWLDGFSADLTETGFPQLAKVGFEPVVVTANAKGYLPFGRYQPFLLVGAGVMTADIKLRDPVGLTGTGVESTSANEFAWRFGGGIDFYATEHVVVSVGADYVLPFGELDALDYITVTWGLQYRF